MPKPRFDDLQLKETLALPNGAATVVGAAIRTGCGTPDDFPVNMEWKIEAPALVVGDLGNGDTVSYSLITAYNEGLTDGMVVLLPNVLVQTGAGGVGAAAAEWQGRAPIKGPREWVGLRAVNSGAGDASDKSATLSLVGG